MKDNRETCLIIMWVISYLLSILFVFSAIGLLSGFDHYTNGLHEDGIMIIEISSCIFIVCLLFIMTTVFISKGIIDMSWSYISSLLFATSLVCFIFAIEGIRCGKCSRLYLNDEINNEALEIAKQICTIIMTSTPLYTFIIILKHKMNGFGYSGLNCSDIICETICETLYCLLSVFVPLFMCVVLTLSDGDTNNIECGGVSSNSNPDLLRGNKREPSLPTHDMV